jgi:hypothetical protein
MVLVPLLGLGMVGENGKNVLWQRSERPTSDKGHYERAALQVLPSAPDGWRGAQREVGKKNGKTIRAEP